MSLIPTEGVSKSLKLKLVCFDSNYSIYLELEVFNLITSTFVIHEELEYENSCTFSNVGKTYGGSLYSRRQKVIQYQYTDWEDYGVPKSTDPILNLVRKIRQEIRSLQLSTTKILVHCSNGMGQTGTFIALYQLMEILDTKMEKMFRKSKRELVENASYYLHNITVDVFDTVFELRSRRMNMVSSILSNLI